MMDHERAEEFLADYEEGGLSDEMAVAMERHLETCLKCSEWLAWYRDLKESVVAGSDHPSSEALALLAVGSSDLSEADRLGVEEHIGECSACRDLVSRSQSALETHSVVTPFRRSIRQARRWVLPVAAGLLLGVFGGRELGKSNSGDGVVPFRVIGPSTRAARDLPEIALSSENDHVLLAVDVPQIQDLAKEALLEIVLMDDEENSVWETRIEVEEIRQASADGRMFLIAIPSGALHPGSFVIHVVLPGGFGRVEFPVFFADG